MREWWKEKDYWDFIKETIITEDKSKDEIIIQNQDALWKKPE